MRSWWFSPSGSWVSGQPLLGYLLLPRSLISAWTLHCAFGMQIRSPSGASQGAPGMVGNQMSEKSGSVWQRDEGIMDFFWCCVWTFEIIFSSYYFVSCLWYSTDILFSLVLLVYISLWLTIRDVPMYWYWWDQLLSAILLWIKVTDQPIMPTVVYWCFLIFLHLPISIILYQHTADITVTYVTAERHIMTITFSLMTTKHFWAIESET